MKKRILGVIAFAAVAIAAGWNYQQDKNEVEMSELGKANMEALAQGESGFNCQWEDRNYIRCDYGFGLGCPCGM